MRRGAGRSAATTLVRSPTVAALAAAALFAAVLVARWDVEGMIISVAIGFVAPIALLAARFGPWAGLGATVLALGLCAGWERLTPAVVQPVQYGALGLVFLVIGLGLGWYSDQLRKEDRKQQEAFAALRESQERYRALMEHAPEAIVVLDVDDDSFLEVNENACRFFELSRAELMQRGAAELSLPAQPGEQPAAQPATQPAAREYLRRAVQGGTPVFEWTYRTPSGRVVPCEVRLVRLPHADRVLVRGSIADISERKRTEAMLAAAEVAGEVAARMSDLTRVTEVALAHLQLKDLLPELAVRVRQILRVDNAGILLVDRTGHLVLETATGVEVSSPRLAFGEGFAGRVAAQRRPVMLRGSEVDALVVNHSLHALRSLLGVPLLSGDRLLGVLHVGTTQDRAFTEEEVNLLQLAAERAALGIEHSRVYEWQRSLANVLQRSLLPRKLPEIPGVELQARYRPAGFQVGGDFYDVVALQDGRWMLCIGDVCGKGPEAAALTALARYTLRAEASHETRPAELLRLLNRTLLRDDNDEGAALLTALCAVLSAVEDGGGHGAVTLDVAAAGHPLPLVQRANGAVEVASGAGEILGVFPEVNPATFVITLQPGDSTVFYTDGLLDAKAPKNILEPGDLAAMLARTTGAGLTESLAALEGFAVGDAQHARDDIAILAVRRTAEAHISGELAGAAATVTRAQWSPAANSPKNPAEDLDEFA